MVVVVVAGRLHLIWDLVVLHIDLIEVVILRSSF